MFHGVEKRAEILEVVGFSRSTFYTFLAAQWKSSFLWLKVAKVCKKAQKHQVVSKKRGACILIYRQFHSLTFPSERPFKNLSFKMEENEQKYKEIKKNLKKFKLTISNKKASTLLHKYVMKE